MLTPSPTPYKVRIERLRTAIFPLIRRFGFEGFKRKFGSGKTPKLTMAFADYLKRKSSQLMSIQWVVWEKKGSKVSWILRPNEWIHILHLKPNSVLERKRWPEYLRILPESRFNKQETMLLHVTWSWEPTIEICWLQLQGHKCTDLRDLSRKDSGENITWAESCRCAFVSGKLEMAKAKQKRTASS